MALNAGLAGSVAEQGPPADWRERHVSSASASAHSWKDWAETWAHHLYMVDLLEVPCFALVNRG